MVIDLERLREIGWTEWDPIEVLKYRDTWVGQPFENEYDHYLIHVADRILVGDDDATLVAYLVAIERDDMYDSSAEVSPERAAATVIAIRKYLDEKRLTRIIEASMLGWKVVDREPQAGVTPVRRVDTGAVDIGTRKAKLWPAQSEESSLATIEPVEGGGLGRKSVVIRNGKIIGMQG
jgi:hypothetical protein